MHRPGLQADIPNNRYREVGGWVGDRGDQGDRDMVLIGFVEGCDKIIGMNAVLGRDSEIGWSFYNPSIACDLM